MILILVSQSTLIDDLDLLLSMIKYCSSMKMWCCHQNGLNQLLCDKKCATEKTKFPSKKQQKEETLSALRCYSTEILNEQSSNTLIYTAYEMNHLMFVL